MRPRDIPFVKLRVMEAFMTAAAFVMTLVFVMTMTFVTAIFLTKTFVKIGGKGAL